MFPLTKEEFENWKSQIATSNPAAKMGLRRPPHAFTESTAACCGGSKASAEPTSHTLIGTTAGTELSPGGSGNPTPSGHASMDPMLRARSWHAAMQCTMM